MISLEETRRAVREERWYLTQHTLTRLGQRRLTVQDLFHAIVQGDILEQYPDDPRGPGRLRTKGECRGAKPL